MAGNIANELEDALFDLWRVFSFLDVLEETGLDLGEGFALGSVEKQTVSFVIRDQGIDVDANENPDFGNIFEKGPDREPA